MKADIKWLDDPEVFRVNQMPAHSDHKFYESAEAMEQDTSAWVYSLNGSWDFHYAENAMERPVQFYQKDADMSGFTKITVPGHIELAGFDKIHYINTMYPWEGMYYRRPKGAYKECPEGIGSFAEAAYNPVGSYRTGFSVPEEMKGKRISVLFEGVEQAMYVWLNGVFIGYAEDSFTPSEFDLTPYLCEGENLLAVEVHKRSSAAYLEDQDFFRFFGIFRGVSLVARPKVHVEDITLQAELLEDNCSGVFRAKAVFSGEKPDGRAKLVLKNPDGTVIYTEEKEMQENLQFASEILQQVSVWENKSPSLYRMELSLYDRKGNLIEIVPYEVGFRRIAIVDKVICLNGKRLILCGVNRHEWSPETGRCIRKEDMEWDIAELKRLQVNAVRTSHYPNQLPWYQMCDRAGIYVMAENNLESHGSWQKMGAVEPSWNVPGDSPLWKEAVLDRARSNYEWFKNHTSILFWSLGNESYAGSNLVAMQQYYKEKQDGRLIHYEGVCQNHVLEDELSDVESRMYETPAGVAAYLENTPKKPYLLCEYMHCMGNSMGGLKHYMQLLDKYDSFHGGFIWDYIDQALWVKDEVSGKRVLRYGGDFDDRPSDYAFSGDGILFADRTEKPAAQEVTYFYGKYKA